MQMTKIKIIFYLNPMRDISKQMHALFGITSPPLTIRDL